MTFKPIQVVLKGTVEEVRELSARCVANKTTFAQELGYGRDVRVMIVHDG